MKNVKIGARALLVMSQVDWQRLVTNTVNLKIGARAKIVVLTEQQRAELTGTISAGISALITEAAAARAAPEEPEA